MSVLRTYPEPAAPPREPPGQGAGAAGRASATPDDPDGPDTRQTCAYVEIEPARSRDTVARVCLDTETARGFALWAVAMGWLAGTACVELTCFLLTHPIVRVVFFWTAPAP